VANLINSTANQLGKFKRNITKNIYNWNCSEEDYEVRYLCSKSR